MFKGLKKFAALIPLLAAGFVMAEDRNGNEIVGTAHDFSSKWWSGNQVCLPCHTPHHAMPNELSGRLWNHALTSTSVAFAYNNNSQAITLGQNMEKLDRLSQMCMGCHDGVTALDAYGTHSPLAGAATGNINIGQGGNATVDLSNDHPVGLFAIYDQNKQHSGHYSYKEETVVSAAGLRLIDVTKAYKRNSDGSITELAGAYKVVGCTTCHNPHGGVDYYMPNADGTAKPTPKKYLLRADPREICISCHTK